MLKDKDIIDKIYEAKWRYEEHSGESPNLIKMNFKMYCDIRDKFIANGYPIDNEVKTIYGMDIVIDNTLPYPVFSLIKIRNDDFVDAMRYCTEDMVGKYVLGKWGKPVTKLPKNYIINKGATILFWDDGSKTIVKRGKDDEYNKVVGFLWAYFQKTSGLSKTKANKYLAGLVEESSGQVSGQVDNESKFKIGDKVVITTVDNDDIRNNVSTGDTGVVIEVNTSVHVQLDKGSTRWFTERQLAHLKDK